MKSLTQGGESNLQDRVIQSGLDAISGTDAPHIITLFKAMAVYAEGAVVATYIPRYICSLTLFFADEMVPVAILNVLWVSLDPNKHKLLSGIRIRQWTSQLLKRSILLGSVSKGLSMVRGT